MTDRHAGAGPAAPGAPAAPEDADRLRRAVDVVVAAAALVALSPLLAAVALAIRVRLGAPVLFTQARSGLGGREFTIYKFRTMRDERYPGEPDADRTPPLGQALRASSLDELPQLFNVLRGDMSLIGPRPTLPEQVAAYSERQRGRLAVRPGLTGYAQVKGRNALSWPERIELDLDYLARRNVLLDAWILVKTLEKLARPEGITGEGGVNPGFPGADGPSDDDAPTRESDPTPASLSGEAPKPNRSRDPDPAEAQQ